MPSTAAVLPPAPAPSELPLTLAGLAHHEDELRTAGFSQAALPTGGWSGTYDLDGGVLRLFEAGPRVTGTFESALRSGGLQGTLGPDGVLDFAWRSTDTGAVRGTVARTGKGVLRPWTGRRGRRLLGTWGYGDSSDGAIWLAVPREPARAKRPRR